MARIAGIEIPEKKRSEIALTYIFGIGKSSAQKILERVKIDPDKKVIDWTEQEAKGIHAAISQDYVVEGDLRRSLKDGEDRRRHINCYRAIRRRLGLPNSARTRTNARTRRKGKKVAIANKKKVTRK